MGNNEFVTEQLNDQAEQLLKEEVSGNGFPNKPENSQPLSTNGSIATSKIFKKTVRASFIRVLWRLTLIFLAGLYWLIAFYIDLFAYNFYNFFILFYYKLQERREKYRARRVELQKRRAKRLKKIVQWLGGAMVKLGQQMSLRLDVLPPAFCDELKNLLDKASHISIKYTKRVIKKLTGRHLEATFSEFCETPVGSASIASVYRAVLKNKQIVAVKVRRPGIEKVFAADLAVLDWIFKSLEYLTIIRPEISMNFRTEIRQMLMEELDFRIEARYQELFLRYYKKRKKLQVSAPKVYHQLSNEEVIVSEFVSGGFWVTDIIGAINGAVDDKNPDSITLSSINNCNINPKKVAKRLIRASYYGFFECPFFYGDPHPANLYVKPNNKIVFVDFGSCGVFADKERNLMRQMHYYYSKEDVGGMVQSVISLMEPLPPMDVNAFTKELENVWWQAYYGIKSSNAEWYERTSFRLWIGLFNLTRKYEVPMPLHLLRMVRATLLYDTVAARLYKKINVFKEYKKYHKDYGKKIRKNIQKAFIKQWFLGPNGASYIRMQRLWDTGNVLLFKLQQFLDVRPPNFSAITDKVYDFIGIFFNFIYSSIIVTFFTLFSIVIFDSNPKSTISKIFFKMSDYDIINNTDGFLNVLGIIWIVLISFLGFLYTRKVLIRIKDKDV